MVLKLFEKFLHKAMVILDYMGGKKMASFRCEAFCMPSRRKGGCLWGPPTSSSEESLHVGNQATASCEVGLQPPCSGHEGLGFRV